MLSGKYKIFYDQLIGKIDKNRVLHTGNSGYGNKSLPLLKKVFEWGWKVRPSQPLTSGVWNLSLSELNKFQVENSDIITYHNYESPGRHQAAIDTLKKYNRPMVCPEYMARRNNPGMNPSLMDLNQNCGFTRSSVPMELHTNRMRLI